MNSEGVFRLEQNKCGVYLISGFLGSGKTTLLKRLLETVPAGERAAVLMNEFGKAGVDGDVVKKNGLEIIEISSGSIFCACAKGDFLRGLYTIFRDYKPSILLIEASGVADTTDIKRDLGHGMLHDFYRFRGNICVADAQRFEDWADLFCAVPKQVEAASHVIINKIDLVSPEDLQTVEDHIRELNPGAKMSHAKYGDVSWDMFLLPVERETAPSLPNSDEWEKFIEAALNDMEANLAPPDKLASQSVFWEGDPLLFEELLEDLPEDIIRSKGYFKDTDGKWKIFDIVGDSAPTYSYPDEEFEMPRNLAIFIRTKRARREIPSLFESKGLKMLEVRFG